MWVKESWVTKAGTFILSKVRVITDHMDDRLNIGGESTYDRTNNITII